MREDITIEPDGDGGFDVYEHGEYERSSVLAGMPRRSWRGCFVSVERALEEFPGAQVLDCSSKPFGPSGGSLGDLSGLPHAEPEWFDAGAAGERWDEDY